MIQSFVLLIQVCPTTEQRNFHVFSNRNLYSYTERRYVYKEKKRQKNQLALQTNILPLNLDSAYPRLPLAIIIQVWSLEYAWRSRPPIIEACPCWLPALLNPVGKFEDEAETESTADSSRWRAVAALRSTDDTARTLDGIDSAEDARPER
jgi:hypothetical protein